MKKGFILILLAVTLLAGCFDEGFDEVPVYQGHPHHWNYGDRDWGHDHDHGHWHHRDRD
jgi:hypothetical protein